MSRDVLKSRVLSLGHAFDSHEFRFIDPDEALQLIAAFGSAICSIIEVCVMNGLIQKGVHSFLVEEPFLSRAEPPFYSFLHLEKELMLLSSTFSVKLGNYSRLGGQFLNSSRNFA